MGVSIEVTDTALASTFSARQLLNNPAAALRETDPLPQDLGPTASQYQGFFQGPHISFNVDANANISGAAASVIANIPGTDATATFRGLNGVGAVQGSGAFNIGKFTPDTSLGTTFKDMNVIGQFATPD